MEDEGPFARQSDPVAAFPYRRGGEIVNVKYRSLSKRFRQEKQAEKVLYGLDDVMNSSEVIIVEGEMDKLALDQAGIRHVVGPAAPSGFKSLPKYSQSLTKANKDTLALHDIILENASMRCSPAWLAMSSICLKALQLSDCLSLAGSGSRWTFC